MSQKIEVELSDKQRQHLEALVRKSSAPAGEVRKAQVLLMADLDRREGRHPDWYVRERTGVSLKQISRIRKRFVEEGLDAALHRKVRVTPPTPPKLDGDQEARLVDLCCSTAPPPGRQRWTIRLLADELCRLQIVTSVSPETVRQCLKKIVCSRGETSGSASLRRIARDSWPAWSRCSTSTTSPSTRRTR